MVSVNTVGTQALVILLVPFLPRNLARGSGGNPIRGWPAETQVGPESVCTAGLSGQLQENQQVLFVALLLFCLSKPWILLLVKVCSCHGAMWKPRWQDTLCLHASASILILIRLCQPSGYQPSIG